MYISAFLLTAVPRTLEWNPTVALIMIVCNVLAIAFGRATIKKPNEGPSLGDSNPLGLSLGALIGCAAFGHLLGVGAILGLSNLGVI
jgi:photosystem I subunit X